MSKPVYSARGIGRRFGSQVALRDVDLDLGAGEILGIAGANGAGKSTLMRILSGVLRPDEGELRLDGVPIRMRSMQEAWRAGIAFVSQELNLFPTLSVRENLALVPGGRGAISGHETARRARDTLDRLGLTVLLAAELGSLSLAERQLVEIARALLRNPRVLILDEPTSALQANEAERLHAILRDLRESGTAIIYISHFIEELLEICDKIIVIRDGRRVPLKQASARPTVPEVVRAMLGERAASAAAHARLPKSPLPGPGLVLAGVRGPISLDLPRLEARPGEVVGLAGLAGSGIEELFAMLFGRIAPAAGSITLPSGAAHKTGTAAAVAAGVAYVPADRKRLGLILRQSIRENVASVRALALGRDGFVLNRRQQAAAAEASCRRADVKMRSVEQPVDSLSGGNQQKVVFAKWIEAKPSLLLLDDPMRGVDIGAKRELHGIIRQFSSEGRVVLIYSSDPSDYVIVADRVLVFVDGRATDELSGDRLNEHGIMTSMNSGGTPAPGAGKGNGKEPAHV